MSTTEPNHYATLGLDRDCTDTHIRTAYRLLDRSELKLEEAIAQLDAMAREQGVLSIFVDFLRDSSRGIAR